MTQQAQPSSPPDLLDLLNLDDPQGPALPLTDTGDAHQVAAILQAFSSGQTTVQTGQEAARPTAAKSATTALQIGGALVVGTAVAALFLGSTQLKPSQVHSPKPPTELSTPPSPSAPTSQATVPAIAPPPQASTADDLLKAANHQRATRHYDQALALYLSVATAHPGSVSAHVALVAAADLELERFGHPKEARALYKRALAGYDNGPVAVEARSGIHRANRQLNADQVGATGASD